MDQKNFIVAIVLSVLIIVGWQAVFPPTKTPPPVATQTAAPAGAPAAAPEALRRDVGGVPGRRAALWARMRAREAGAAAAPPRRKTPSAIGRGQG